MLFKNSKKAFTLVEIMIVVAIIAMIVAVAIPNLLRARVESNDASAKAALKSISTALESYAALNSVYPTVTNDLLAATPPYLQIDYFSGPHNGFTFNANLTQYTYQITAVPVNSSAGSGSFTISTGAVLVEN
ncbi:MAG: prepilin-type N-terminal cleavage/methylation domain-containing protein [Candidatus Omnitrophica bacterium]|nr:prepilin-type N-terminal cleavage/methylation domain-containing protein [Candidatus Omnitrophota bacterium]MCB9748357.1 prepilin-type N-terminal cleavage/methylation domain-containing protein [Candidatus Omnitrophota bacterium]